MDGTNYVLTTHILSTIPSSTVLHLIRNRVQSQGYVEHPYVGVAAWTKSTPSAIAEVKRAVGGPEQSEFVPLPESRHEVQMVADDLPKPSTILLGEDATETRFKELPLRDYGVLHLALHGYADLNYPDRSALVFAPENGQTDDGLLQVREIRKLTLNASLVTLSACDTGLGPVGEAGVANLANAFVEAGAQTIVSALWDLEDHATARLMAQFYSRLSQGMGKAEALQQAQLELAHAGLSPYYWASFEVVGDPSGHLYPGLPVALSSTSNLRYGETTSK
jgi:CHAT domain-containing protein